MTTASPRTSRAWTASGTPHEHRGLRLRPHQAIRIVPIPAELARLHRHHLDTYSNGPGGRLFTSPRGGMLHESCFGGT